MTAETTKSVYYLFTIKGAVKAVRMVSKRVEL